MIKSILIFELCICITTGLWSSTASAQNSNQELSVGSKDETIVQIKDIIETHLKLTLPKEIHLIQKDMGDESSSSFFGDYVHFFKFEIDRDTLGSWIKQGVPFGGGAWYFIDCHHQTTRMIQNYCGNNLIEKYSVPQHANIRIAESKEGQLPDHAKGILVIDLNDNMVYYIEWMV